MIAVLGIGFIACNTTDEMPAYDEVIEVSIEFGELLEEMSTASVQHKIMTTGYTVSFSGEVLEGEQEYRNVDITKFSAQVVVAKGTTVQVTTPNKANETLLTEAQYGIDNYLLQAGENIITLQPTMGYIMVTESTDGLISNIMAKSGSKEVTMAVGQIRYTKENQLVDLVVETVQGEVMEASHTPSASNGIKNQAHASDSQLGFEFGDFNDPIQIDL